MRAAIGLRSPGQAGHRGERVARDKRVPSVKLGCVFMVGVTDRIEGIHFFSFY